MRDYKAVVHERDKVCKKCGGTKRLTVHHIIPRCQGGLNTPENCILLCRECHCKLHEKEGYPSQRRRRKCRRRRHIRRYRRR